LNNDKEKDGKEKNNESGSKRELLPCLPQTMKKKAQMKRRSSKRLKRNVVPRRCITSKSLCGCFLKVYVRFSGQRRFQRLTRPSWCTA